MEAWMRPKPWPWWRLSTLLGLAVLFLIGCGGDDPFDLTPLDQERQLYPPTKLALSADQELIALVTDGETRNLALYRADSLGEKWSHWITLPTSAATGDVGLTVAGESALIVGANGAHIWSITLPLRLENPTDISSELVTLDAGAPVVTLDLDASLPDTNGVVHAHLVCLLRPSGDEKRMIHYRGSTDAGQSWSEPETLATGDLGRPGLFAHSGYKRTVDVCFRRGEFMTWRGSGNYGRSWIREKPIRAKVSPGSRSAIARKEVEVLAICENHLHQVVGSTSLNHGYNWERAIAIVRTCDHVRVPSLDAGGGLFWVACSQGDTSVVLRSTTATMYPKHWNPGILAALECCMGAPDVVAMPDSTAGLLFGTPKGTVYFSRVRQPSRR